MGAALKSFRACGIRLALSGRGTLIVDESWDRRECEGNAAVFLKS